MYRHLLETLRCLIYANDYSGNKEKTIEYCNKIITKLDDMSVFYILLKIHLYFTDNKHNKY